MRTIVLLSILSLSIACRSTRHVAQQNQRDSSQTAQQQGGSQSTTIKDNFSLIGAVISAIDTLSEFQYTLHIHLQTALPAGSLESLAEPGQQLEVIPLYHRDESGKIDWNDVRNKRLVEVCSKKEGDFLLGKISLGKNGKWYLIDTQLD